MKFNPMKARAVFFGAGDFAVPALRALAGGGSPVEVALAVCPPPRPFGRKLNLRDCPAAAEAKRLGVEVAEVAHPADAIARIKLAGGRCFVVCDYGSILPRGILRLPRDGGINIHASLLPRWRGASPIRSAILAGDDKTGVTIMRMDMGLDTGMMLLSRETAIGAEENAGELTSRLAEMGAELIVEALTNLRDLEELPQLGDATYAPKLSPDERWLNFNADALAESRRIRAFAPSPGARMMLRGTEIKVLGAKAAEGVNGNAGSVLAADESGLTIGFNRGALTLTRLQKAGGRVMDAGEFLRGFKALPGDLAERK